MNYAQARHNMVEGQIRTNKVTDPLIIEAMERLPRELFVPKPLRGIAYVDEDVELAPGRFLMEPMVLARLIQSAEIGRDEVVLDVGCGTGYSSGLLAAIASTVVALEVDPDLAGRATALMGELGIDNVAVVTGPLAEGYPAQAPYNVILFSGAVSEVPANICNQLAEGGRLVAVVVGEDKIGRATLFTRIGGSFSSRVLFEAGTPLLLGFQRKPGFVF